MPTSADCAICKKLKPLTFIHAKHCVAAPGEPCVIPYCARAKRDLQLLVHRRQQQPQQVNTAAGASTVNSIAGNQCGPAAGLQSGAVLSGLSVAGVMSSNAMALSGHPGPSIESMGTQAQAHYLLILAHVMKCPSAHWSALRRILHAF